MDTPDDLERVRSTDNTATKRSHMGDVNVKPEPGAERPVKYILVTGGVVSSLGKGLAAASIGALLEGHGYASPCRSSIPTSTSTPAR